MVDQTLNANWHFFLAHAGPDKAIAEQLYDQLKADADVFLDSKSIQLGDDWDRVLSTAQRSSLITVVLISSNTENAYYQREEIAAAIALARSNEKHRVVPVYLNQAASASDNVPYGLRLKHGVVLSDEVTIKNLVLQLSKLRHQLTQSEIPETLEREFSHSAQCWTCGLDDVERYESIVVEKFEAFDAGWAIGGNIKLQYCAHNKCRNCGSMFDDIRNAIPVNYPDMKCQDCGSVEHLKCRIKNLNKEKQNFTFQAVVQCKNCGTSKPLQRALKSLWSVIAVTVTLGGISLD